MEEKKIKMPEEVANAEMAELPEDELEKVAAGRSLYGPAPIYNKNGRARCRVCQKWVWTREVNGKTEYDCTFCGRIWTDALYDEYLRKKK